MRPEAYLELEAQTAATRLTAAAHASKPCWFRQKVAVQRLEIVVSARYLSAPALSSCCELPHMAKGLSNP